MSASALPELGFDHAEEFFRVMNGREALARVKADIEEGIRLGIQATPMIFIGGKQLKGTEAPRAIERAIAAVRREVSG